MRELLGAVVAAGGIWLMSSQYSACAALARAYAQHGTEDGTAATANLSTLHWERAAASAVETGDDRLAIVTNAQPSAYQLFASIDAQGAGAVDLQFDGTVESGGLTIGVMQSGRWIGSVSSQGAGPFSGALIEPLRSGSLTIMLANNNPDGESRATFRSLRVFLRR